MPYKLKCESCQAIGEIDDPVDIFTCPCCNGTMRPLKETTAHDLDNVPTMVISRDDLRALREAKATATIGQRPTFGKKGDTASKTFSRPMPQISGTQKTTATPTVQQTTTVSRTIFAQKSMMPRPIQAIRPTPPPAPVEPQPDTTTVAEVASKETSTVADIASTPVVPTPISPVIEEKIAETPVIHHEPILPTVETPKIEAETPKIPLVTPVAEVVIEETVQAPVTESKTEAVKTAEILPIAAVVTPVTPIIETVIPVVVPPVTEAVKTAEIPPVATVVTPVTPIIETVIPVVVPPVTEAVKTAEPVIETAKVVEPKPEVKTIEIEKPTEVATPIIPVTPPIVAEEKKTETKIEETEKKAIVFSKVETPKIEETKVEEKTDTTPDENDKKPVIKKKSLFGKEDKSVVPLGGIKKTASKKADTKNDGEKVPTTNEKGQLLKRLKTGKFEIVKDAKGVAVYAPDGVLLNEADTEKYLKVFADKRKKVAIMLSIVTIIFVGIICGILALIIKGF